MPLELIQRRSASTTDTAGVNRIARGLTSGVEALLATFECIERAVAADFASQENNEETNRQRPV